MKIPVSILKKFLKTEKTTPEITEKLTNIGLEVEEVLDRSDLGPFLVAQIINFEKHPNADKLNICKVDIGSEVLQIVCGAENVKSGMKTIFAKIGTIIPNGKFEIKQAKIRGLDSFGMLCSYDELLLDSGFDGIAELPDFFEVGKSFAKQAGLDDETIEISLTPNRGDCASIIGVARDLSACDFGEFLSYKNDFKFEKNSDLIDNICEGNSFSLLKIEDVSAIKSPIELESSLVKFGLKPKNLLVDLTNYTMMLFGQPMHAYDADKIKGKISVKMLEEDCDFVDLKDATHKLKLGDLVICDEEKIIAIAGIIGSKSSAISENTTKILLEAANFDTKKIAKTGQRLNITSDARFRFERGVDQNLMEISQGFVLSEILKNIPNAKITACDFGITKSAKIQIEYQFSLFEKVIGVGCDNKVQKEILQKLGFEIISGNQDLIEVLVPSFRYDISNDKDLVEEIFRIYGCEKVVNLPIKFIKKGKTKFDENWEKTMSIKKTLAGIGYDEVITMPFQHDDIVSKIRYDGSEAVKLFNPISSLESSMRKSALVGLFDLFCKEFLQTRDENINVFECASVFLDRKTFNNQTNLGILSSGSFGKGDFRNLAKKSSFDEIKSHVFAILSSFYDDLSDLSFEKMDLDFAHSYKSFYIAKNHIRIGSIGQFSYEMLSNLGISNDVYFAEIFDINNLERIREKSKKPETDLQKITREFAFILDKNVAIGDFINALRLCDGSIFGVTLLDIFESDKWENARSLAISFDILQEKQLSVGEVNEISEKIINIAEKNFAAKLRDGVFEK